MEELPDVIPEELYAAELESPEEQQAFQQLLEPPPSPAAAPEELEPEYQQPGYQQPGYQDPGYHMLQYQQPGYQLPSGYQAAGEQQTPGASLGMPTQLRGCRCQSSMRLVTMQSRGILS